MWNRTCRIGKAKVELESLIGLVYGSLCEIDHGILKDCTDSLFDDEQMGKKFLFLSLVFKFSTNSFEINKWNIEKCSDRDNRSYVDDNTAQKLSSEEIRAMREAGVSGRDIIDALVKSSTTFDEKTAFSQQKYLKKKANK